MKQFIFVTGNLPKVEWLQKFLGREVEHFKLDIDELQSPDPYVVLEHKARAAYQQLARPVLVDDVSLIFHAWGNMPGTFVKFFVEGPGLEKMCRMLDGFDDRGATMRVSYGYFDGESFTMLTGETEGSIAKEMGDDKMGHGFDPIFIPVGETQPHGSLSDEVYRRNHPRGKAVEKLKLFLEDN